RSCRADPRRRGVFAQFAAGLAGAGPAETKRLAAPRQRRRLAKAATGRGRRVGIDVELWTPAEARRRVPVLEQAQFEGAAWCASDGIVDIHALLSGYLKAALSQGARVRYDCQVRAIRAGADGFEIATNGAPIRARILVNAAGAWANVV